MTELKKLPTTSEKVVTTKKTTSKLTFGEGLYFGLGFWTAGFVFSFIIVPAMFCLAVVLLAIFGQTISSFVPSR